MTKNTATIAVLVVVAAYPTVSIKLAARRRNKAEREMNETVASINAMMNKMDGTTDVTHVSL